MTIVFSASLPDFVVMVSDTAVRITHSDSSREYREGQKAYCFPGIGCVTTWGRRDHNRIGEFLDQQLPSLEGPSVVDLSTLVDAYLREVFRPHELQQGGVGYHVGGFDRDGRAHLDHIFWGFDLPIRPDQCCEEYRKQVRVIEPGRLGFLYNGRNDLADMMVRTLLDEIRHGNDVHFDLATAEGLVLFGDFIVRFAAELTPQVGRPFFIHLISPENRIERVINNTLCPVDRDEVSEKLFKLGVSKLAPTKKDEH